MFCNNQKRIFLGRPGGRARSPASRLHVNKDLLLQSDLISCQLSTISYQIKTKITTSGIFLDFRKLPPEPQ